MTLPGPRWYGSNKRRRSPAGAGPGVASNLVVVQMADLQVSANPAHTLITYALGSCVGLVVYDPLRRVGGLLHFMLPESSIAPAKAQVKPAMFCDTGVPLLLERMVDHGARLNDLVVKVAGAGVINDPSGVFAVGRRNCVALVEVLAHHGLRSEVWAVAGRESSTLSVHVGTGAALVRSRGREVVL